MSKDTGGPTFPTREKIGEEFVEERGCYRDVFGEFGGMTLRDYFAAKAMAALIAQQPHQYVMEQFDGIRGFKYVSETAFVCADAMIAERAKCP